VMSGAKVKNMMKNILNGKVIAALHHSRSQYMITFTKRMV